MKKTLLGLLVLIPLAGCASSGPAYGPVYSSAGFYDECLYGGGYCYDGFSRYGYYYGYGYPIASAELQRAKVERLKRSGSTRVVTRSGGGSATSASSRSVNVSRSSSSRSTAAVAPRGGSSHSSSRSSAPVSHGSSRR